MVTKTQLLKAIRKHCMECCSNSYTWVEACPGSDNCAIHQYRMGDPDEPSDAMKERGRNLAKTRIEKKVTQENTSTLIN
jgi:hypothetical protein